MTSASTRSPRRLLGAALLVVPVVLACSGNSCSRQAAKVVPALEKMNPELALDPVECDKPITTPAPRGCAMQTITCGDELTGNNSYGRYNFDDDFYNSKFCTPERHDYDQSPEAIYQLKLPANVEADVYLVSDCEELDLASVQWTSEQRCPTIDHTTGPCEMNAKKAGGSIRITTVDKPETHLVIVDGKRGATGNFRIKVSCGTYR
jgi:hypothetical protein